MDASKTLSGAQLLTCEQDVACPSLDCEALVKEYGMTLQGPDAAEVVAHFCGLGYLERSQADGSPESAVETPGDSPEKAA